MAALSQTLCSLRNAQRAQKRYVPILFSKMTWSLLKILLVNGYIKGFFLQEKQIQVFLKQREEGRGLQKFSKFLDLNNEFILLTKSYLLLKMG